MRKLIAVAVFVAMFTIVSNAQNYTSSIGLRGALSTGLTFKHFTSDSKALEGIFTSRWGGWNITGLLEIHQPFEVDGLTWFYGVGGHIGVWDASDNRNWFGTTATGAQTVIGVDGIIGLEFTIPNVPVNFQLDYKPGFNLIGHNGWWGDEAAVSIRYILK